MNRRPETVLYSIVAFVSLATTAAAIVVIVAVLANRNRPVRPTQVAVGITATTAAATLTVPPLLTDTPLVANPSSTKPFTVAPPTVAAEVASPVSTDTPAGPPTSENTESPIEATNRSSTIRAIIDPRLTETMEQIALGPTGLPTDTNQPVETIEPTLTRTAKATNTATPLVTATPFASVTKFVAVLASPVGGTAATIDPTNQFATIRAIIAPRLTLTAEKANIQTATSQVMDTATFAVYQTQTALVETETATPTNTDTGYTSTPLNGTDMFQTAVSGANELLTQTYALARTQAFQLTVNSIINQTLGISPTATITNTPTPTISPTVTSTAPTATLNPTQTFATLLAAFNNSLTETPQAQIAGSVTAVLQSTLQGLMNQQTTATAAMLQTGLAQGYDAITAQNATRLSIVLTVKNHNTSTNSIAFSPNGTQFASANTDNSVRLWDTVTGSEIISFPGLTDRLSVSISADDNYIAAASSDGTVRLWDIHTKQEIAPLRGHTKGVTNALFSPTSSLLASISSDGTTQIGDVKGGGAGTTLKQPAQAIAFSPDGLRLLTGGQDAKITTWESLTGIELSSIRDTQPVTALTFSDDGRLLASGGTSAFVSVWDAQSGGRVQMLKGPTKPISSVAFCADNSCVAAASKDGSIWLWNMQTGAEILTLTGAEGGVNSIAISTDGRKLVIAGADSTIVVWAIPAN